LPISEDIAAISPGALPAHPGNHWMAVAIAGQWGRMRREVDLCCRVMATPTLAVGELAPPFVATTGDGATIRLADYLGNRGLVLFFYPRDGTPVCTKQACGFRDAYTKFVDAGFEVIGVSSGSAKSHRAFAQQH